MYCYQGAAVLLLCVCCVSVAHARSDASKFFGAFELVNQTVFNADGSTTYSEAHEPTGGILLYAPTATGSTSGIVTALLGDSFNSSDDVILATTTGYVGLYFVNDTDQTVTHVPTVSLDPSIVGQEQIREYSFAEDDNILNFQIVESSGFLSATQNWRRTEPLQPDPQCSFSLAVTRLSSWDSNGETHVRAMISVTNTGSLDGVSATLSVATNGVDVEDISLVTPIDGITGQYQYNLYGLVPGSILSAAQIQFVGSGDYSVSLVATYC